MNKTAQTASIAHAAVRRPREELVETGIRKLYPYLNRWRNPMRVSVQGRAACVHHGGQKDHYFAIYQCFYRHQYELPVPLFSAPHQTQALDARYRAIIARGGRPLILDCGANIGAGVAWFAARYPGARIVAVEPAASNLELLRRNAQGVDAAIVAGAVGPVPGRAVLQGRLDAPLSFQVAGSGAAPQGGQAVEVFDLPALIELAEGAEPFIAKIDIEGAECGLFTAHLDILARFPLIVLEPHDFCMPGQEISSGFFAFHAQQRRDFLFANENVFSVDYRALSAPRTVGYGALSAP